MSFDLSDYVDVSERQRLFFERYPDGRIQTELEEVRNAAGELIAWKCRAAVYRTVDDAVPAIDSAVEPVPGKTPYTKDSEAMNASTSAVGRAIVLAGFPSKHIASADEVRARSGAGSTDTGRENPAPQSEAEAQPAPDNPAVKAQAAQQAAKDARTPADDGKPENVVLTFGKHKGTTVGDAPRHYIEWLVEQFEPKTAEQRRIHTAAQYVVSPPIPDDDGIPF